MKSQWRRFVIAFGVIVPVVIFLSAREAASWRPHKLVRLPVDPAMKVALSPDEKLVANAGTNLLTVRSIESGAEIYHERLLSCPGNPEHVEVGAIAFSPDSRQLALCWTLRLENGVIQKMGIRLTTLGRESRNFAIPYKNFGFNDTTQIHFSPDGQNLWLASTNNFRAWDLKSGRLVRQWHKSDSESSASWPYFSVLSLDCQTFFHVDEDGFSVWDTKIGKLVRRYKLEALDHANIDIEMSPEASLLICSDFRKGVRWVVESRTGKRLWKGGKDTQLISEKIAYSRIGTKSIDICDSKSGQRLTSVGQLPNLDTLFPSHDESRVYALDNDGQLWRQRIR